MDSIEKEGIFRRNSNFNTLGQTSLNAVSSLNVGLA